MDNAHSWTHYWQQGHQESCIDNQSSDNSELDTLWQNVANQLSEQDVVVDLATGNGSVLRKLYQYQSKPHYIGVDYADIQPTWATDCPSVKFIGNTDIATLPFEDGQADLVTSQFGFEYGLSSSSLAELARVLKEKGQLALVIHHHESEVVQPAKNRLNELSNLLLPSGVIDQVILFINKTKTAQALEKVGQNYLSQYQGQITQSVSGQCFQVVNKVIELVESGEEYSAERLFTQFKESMKQEQSRLTQLINVAKDQQAVTDIICELKTYGVTSKAALVNTNQNQIIGWFITGIKHG